MKAQGKRRAGPGKPAASAHRRKSPSAKAPARGSAKAPGAAKAPAKRAQKAPGRRPASSRRKAAGAAPARRPTVVVYFSRFGATAVVAREIARELGAEVREIRATRRQSWLAMGWGAMFNIRYPIEPMDTDLSGAGAVVLCSPIWAGKPACQVMTFLDSARLAGTRSAVVFTTWGMDLARASAGVREVLQEHGSQPVGCQPVVVRGVGEESLRTASRAVGRELKQKLQ